MAEISPFNGIRYNLQKVCTLQSVVAPPYDIISPAEQEELYQRHPANVVRLILGKQEPGDDDAHNRYTRAATSLQRWLDDGTLLRERRPALYPYRIEYEDPAGAFRSLTLLLCRVRLEVLGQGSILPHEATLSGPKEDRLHLLRATRANLSPVFSLFSDPAGEFERLCAECTAQPPVDTATDTWGARHRLWASEDASFAAALRMLLSEKALFIADGHHRYETALRYRDEVRAANGGQAGPWDWVLMAIGRLESPGITVLPTHRVVRGVAPERLAALEENARQFFAVTAAAGLEDLMAGLAGEFAAGRHAFGFYLPGAGFRLLRLEREAEAEALLDPSRAPAWRRLDVALLHGVVVDHLLGLTTEQAMQAGQIGYVKDAAECVRRVNAGDYQAALFLNPTPPQAVKEVALAGEKMPQKSTYFFPKLLSGLVLNPVDVRP